MALIEPRVAQGLAAAAGVESVDTFAASVISSELESRVRQIVAEAMDVQRHTLEPRLTGAHVMAALKQHALPVSWDASARRRARSAYRKCPFSASCRASLPCRTFSAPRQPLQAARVMCECYA